MEEHLEHHGNERPFKCSICEKGFYMKWRMEKHTSDHRVDIKFCHYFNNDKPCPYDKVGCKFKHETAPECRFNLKCTFNLCQFTHTTKKGEEVVHRQELETLNEGVVETRGHLLPAIISTDRTIAHREFIKPLENAEKKSAGAVELNEENDHEDSESFLADMENMEGVVEDNEESYDENDDSDTDTSYNRQLKKNMAMNDTDMKMKYDAAVDRYGGQDYPSDMIDTDSSDGEEMTIKDYERMMKSVW